MADQAGDSPQLLHVQMEQLSGALALVAPHRLRRLRAAPAGESRTLEDQRHGRAWPLQLGGDPGPGHARLPQLEDQLLPGGGRGARHPLGTRTAVRQAGLALVPVAPQPLEGAAPAEACGGRRLGDRPPLRRDALHQQHSTRAAASCSTVDVHPGLLSVGLEWLEHHPTSNRRTPVEQRTSVNNLFGLHT